MIKMVQGNSGIASSTQTFVLEGSRKNDRKDQKLYLKK